MEDSPSAPDDGDTSVQFIPTSLKPKKRRRRPTKKQGIGIGVVMMILAVVLALITGLLVWHLHIRRAERVKKMYSGSMKISGRGFHDDYEDPESPAFQDLASQVVEQLNAMYTKNPRVSKYYVGSSVQAFSEDADQDNVVAYYMSEFEVSQGQESVVDGDLTSEGEPEQSKSRRFRTQESGLQFQNMVTGAVDPRLDQKNFKIQNKYSYHAQSNKNQTIQSLGFPTSPYLPESFTEWELRADPSFRIKLDFVKFTLEDNCKKDFVKVYDSLVAIEMKAMAERCGSYPPNEPLSFISSRNVMLVTMVTNKDKNFPGFQAVFTQIPQALACGGKLTGLTGTFKSPNYPGHYPPSINCVWDIEVPMGQYIKVQFKKFFLAEPGVSPKTCPKDYVEINQVRLCGGKLRNTVMTSNSNTMRVTFNSDKYYVDQGFLAEFQAFEPSNPCPGKFKCYNMLCINPSLKCDGWDDCGDNSDEKNCKCDEKTQIACKNTLCKPKMWQCDGVNDCGDNTDEESCGACSKEQFTCLNARCVSNDTRCDGNDDCEDGSDELDCGGVSVVPCTELTYKCKNEQCINKLNPECDNAKDCEDGSDEANCECGKSPYKTAKIVGGQDAYEGEWPWQVSLHVQDKGHVCGASVLNNRFIVTAAHCVQDRDILYSSPDVWDVYLGLHIQQVISKTTEQRKLKRIIPHPDYNHFTSDNDIALMELDSPVLLNNNIWPICLPTETQSFPAGTSVWITGWGATRESGFLAKVLQKAEVRIINDTVCDRLLEDDITPQMLCAGVISGGVDACQGDSGGPLSYLGANGRYYLAGVISWGEGCARRNKAGVYTRVTKFRRWIKEHTGV